MSDQSNERSKHAETIIRNHTVLSMGAGFIPVIGADILAVSALQLDMIRQLCRVYEVSFAEQQGKAIVSALTTSTISRVVARSAVKLIPVVGSVLGGVSVSIFAGASTYALGEVFRKHFESGGTILDFDPERLKKVYQEKFEKGKKVAEELSKQQKPEKEPIVVDVNEPTPGEAATFTAPKAGSEVVSKLKELAELRDQGVISEEEFQEVKKRILDSF